MRVLVAALVVVLSSGCERPSVATTASEDHVAESAAPDPYAAYEFPPISDRWGLPEYAKVRDVLLEIERTQPELIVTLAGPKGDVLARVTSLDKLAADLAATTDMQALLDLHEAVGTIYKLYAVRIDDRQPYGSEFLQLAAAVLRASTTVSARLTEVFDEATLRAEPIRREGFLELRLGLAITYLGAIEAPLQLPTIVDPSLAVAQLEPIAAEVAPYLLPDERQTLDRLLTALAAAGAQVSTTRASIAASPMHPIIAVFADEAQAYSVEQRQRHADAAKAQRRAVELGPEPGGIRFAFPEAGFSAVFRQRPNAILTNLESNGVTLTVRVLEFVDANGYVTSIVCLSRPPSLPADDGESFARKMIEGVEATNVRQVEIDGRRGFEGALSKPSAHSWIRTVDIDRGVCTIAAEVSPQRSTSDEQQARAFLDSVELGGFEG
jgi:hypothetical protein